MNAHEVLLLTPEEAGREINLALSGARFRQMVDNTELRAPRAVGGWRRIPAVDGALPGRQASSQARKANCRKTRIRNVPCSKAKQGCLSRTIAGSRLRRRWYSAESLGSRLMITDGRKQRSNGKYQY